VVKIIRRLGGICQFQRCDGVSGGEAETREGEGTTPDESTERQRKRREATTEEREGETKNTKERKAGTEGLRTRPYDYHKDLKFIFIKRT